MAGIAPSATALSSSSHGFALFGRRRRQRCRERESSVVDERAWRSEDSRFARRVQVQAARIVARALPERDESDVRRARVLRTPDPQRLASRRRVGVVDDGQRRRRDQRVAAGARAPIEPVVARVLPERLDRDDDERGRRDERDRQQASRRPVRGATEREAGERPPAVTADRARARPAQDERRQAQGRHQQQRAGSEEPPDVRNRRRRPTPPATRTDAANAAADTRPSARAFRAGGRRRLQHAGQQRARRAAGEAAQRPDHDAERRHDAGRDADADRVPGRRGGAPGRCRPRQSTTSGGRPRARRRRRGRRQRPAGCPRSSSTAPSARKRRRSVREENPTARSVPTSRTRCSMPSLKNDADSSTAATIRKKLK